MVEDVRRYYDDYGPREWARLESPDGAIEFAVNCRHIAAHLEAGARVLDLGGGPGRYTIWLAERGHPVVLADLSAALLAIARERIASSAASARVEEVVEADARDLSRWPDGAFDAVLCMGPFYHLIAPADRDLAAAELARVLRPGGLAFIALIPRYLLLRRTMSRRIEWSHLTDRDFVARLLDDGAFVNDVPGAFTTAHGVVPQEVPAFFARHGLDPIALLASDGLACGVEGPLAEMAVEAPEAYAVALALIVKTASDPALHGNAVHLLHIARRRPG